MVAPAVICKLQYPRAGLVEEGQRMLLARERHNLAKRHFRILLPGLLVAIVVSFWSRSAAAQTCAAIDSGQNRGKCVKAGAACKSGGTQGFCATSGAKGEYECNCKTPTPSVQPFNCKVVNVCPAGAPLDNRAFYIQDLGGGRCIDAGPPQSWAQGSPVFINACNQTNGQEILVTELESNDSNDDDHDVELSVYPISTNARLSTHLAVTAPTGPGASTGATNAGFCIGVHGGTVAPGAALELQTCNPFSPAQRFAVDGDAILMGLQTSKNTVTRDFVIERQNGSTVPQTPLVVATRVLGEEEPLRIDARYFRFNAADGSGAPPTSGFVTVVDEASLFCAAQCGWGTVVQIDPSQDLVLTTPLLTNVTVRDGTTVRGYRSQTFNGPEMLTCVAPQYNSLPAGDLPFFLATGNEVRFTGFRLQGPDGDSRCGQVTNSASEPAIEVSRNDLAALPSVWIDHMEISHWPNDPGVFVADPNQNAQLNPSTPPGLPTDTPAVLMVGNFMHNNQTGVNSGGALFSQIRANVFYGGENQLQPVSSREGGCLGGYAAMDNLFLTETGKHSSDDVDMHGSFSLNSDASSWDSGLTGDYFDVGWNTFLKTVDVINPFGLVNGNFIANVNQRGSSCRFIGIHDNVFLQAEGTAIRDAGNAAVEYGNINEQDPAQLLLVGDFDGDKVDDVFLATGAAWYYSSGGQAEWRYLNRAHDPASALLLGDFDGDGRTDVLAVHGPNIDVSWAGVSAWQTINQTAWPIADLAVGDFDGDGRSDLLLTTGTQWFLASGGRNWKKWPVSYPDKIPNLRFGHFTDRCGTQTQILRVQKGQWQVTCLGMNSWKPIGAAPVDSANGLVAGDFAGNGFTDLAESVFISSNPSGQAPQPGPLYQWQYTSPGHGSSWSPLGTYSSPIQSLPIGNFQGGKQDGVITWGPGLVPDNYFYFTHAPQNQPQLLSRQVMQ
jgi:hypothetical protein